MKRADIVTVRSLFSGGARLRCGPARPGFHWEPPKIVQMVVDLENAARDSHDEEDVSPERFYLGVITVSPPKSGFSTLLDGQQRLIVLAMYIAFARDRLPPGRLRARLDRLLVRRGLGRAPEPSLRLAPEDHAWFSHFILPPGATTRLPQTTPLGSPRELLLCARFMEHAFSLYSPDVLVSIVDFLLHHTAVCRSVAEQDQPAVAHMAQSAPSLSAPQPTRPAFSGNTWNDNDPVPAARYRVAAE